MTSRLDLDDAALKPLLQELDAWAASGSQATLWWRDDDCIEPTPALDRMTRLSTACNVPLGLAVIPAHASAALADRLRDDLTVFVLLHGFAHLNHAGKGERAAEFGAHRSVETRAAEIADGWRRLAYLPRRVPVFVPPWNRFDPDIANGVARAGINVISAFGPSRPLSSGVVEANCHCDIISWKTTRGFTGVTKSVAMIVEHLAARRTGSAPAAEVTGVLSHHLDHDEGCWAFLETLFRLTHIHPGARWVSPSNLTSRTST
jgi:predicted deacetylase